MQRWSPWLTVGGIVLGAVIVVAVNHFTSPVEEIIAQQEQRIKKLETELEELNEQRKEDQRILQKLRKRWELEEQRRDGRLQELEDERDDIQERIDTKRDELGLDD